VANVVLADVPVALVILDSVVVPDVCVALVILDIVVLVVLVVSVAVEVLDIVVVVADTVVVVMFHCLPSNIRSVSEMSTMSIIISPNVLFVPIFASAAIKRLKRSAGSRMLPVSSDRTAKA
jgi:hypothetical protein